MKLAHQSLYSFSMHYSVLQSLYSLACITDTKPVSQQDTQLYIHASHDFQLYMTIQTECLEDSFFSGLKLALRHRSQIPSHFIMYVMMCALCELYWMSVAIDHGVRIKNLHQLSHVLSHWNIIYHVDLCPSFQRLQPHCCAPQFNFNVCYYPDGIRKPLKCKHVSG